MPGIPLSFRHRRLIIPLRGQGLRQVLLLGRYHYNEAQPALRDHTHPGAMEICFLVKGRQNYRVGGRDYRLRGGDIFLTFPNERHSTGEAPEEKGILYWLVLRLSKKGEPFLGLPARMGAALQRGLLAISSRHFRGSRRMQEDLDAIALAHAVPATDLSSIQNANRLQDFLLEVIRCSRHPAVERRRDSLQPVLDYISQHGEETPSVPDLAARAGLSVARFTTYFKEETGIPPAEFVLRAKIEEARRRLARGGGTVTEIAYALGFSSSQYFATVFRRLEGRSPRDVLSTKSR